MKKKLFLFVLMLFTCSVFAEESPEHAISNESASALVKIEKELVTASKKESQETDKSENKGVLDDEDQDDLKSSESTTVSYEKAFIKMIFVLVLILAIVIVVFVLFKKFSASRMSVANHAKSIKILEKRAISPKSMLYLVEVGGKKLLLAESQLEIRNVSHLEWIESTKTGV